MGLSEVHFTYAFGMNSMGIAWRLSWNASLIGRVAQRTVLTFGAFAIVTISALLTLHFAGPSLVPTLALLFAFTTSVGLMFGNASALAMGEARHIAGSASALTGTVQSLMGGLAAPLVSLAGPQAYMPMALAMVGFATLACLSLVTTPKAESDDVTDRPSPAPT